MKERYEFTPGFRVVNEFEGLADSEKLSKEISMFACTPDFVRENGGDIANKVLDNVPDWYFEEAREKKLSTNIDIRVHYLEKGDFPAYPGWHCDNSLRETQFAQNSEDQIRVSKNLTATVSNYMKGISNTQFLNQSYSAYIENNLEEFEMWAEIDKKLRSENNLNLVDIDDGQMTCFDTKSLHRAMPAKTNGWRLFFRMSMWEIPENYHGGNLAKLEQVYKPIYK